MPSQSIRFPGGRGAELTARLDTPAGPPRAYALFAHCFTCSKDSKAAAYVSQALAGYGIASLRFDFSGLEFTSNIEDLLAAAAWLRARRTAGARGPQPRGRRRSRCCRGDSRGAGRRDDWRSV